MPALASPALAVLLLAVSSAVAWAPAPSHLRLARAVQRERAPSSRRAAKVAAATEEAVERVVTMTEASLEQIAKMRTSQSTDELVVRLGVRAGGCSGMSYTMDLEEEDKIAGDDTIEQWDGFRVIIDAKSLLFIFGMELDYSNELIGGGFQFNNPNAEASCGCGKSFAV